MKITAFIKRNRVKLLLGLIVLCTALGAAFIGTAGTDRLTTDAASYEIPEGTYIWNDTPELGSFAGEFTLDFSIITNDFKMESKNKIIVTVASIQYQYNDDADSKIIAYSNHQWNTPSENRTIFVNKQTVTPEFFDWFQANTERTSDIKNFTAIVFYFQNTQIEAINSISGSNVYSFEHGEPIYIKGQQIINIEVQISIKTGYEIDQITTAQCTLTKTSNGFYDLVITKYTVATITLTTKETEEPEPDIEYTISGTWTLKESGEILFPTTNIEETVNFTYFQTYLCESITVTNTGIISAFRTIEQKTMYIYATNAWALDNTDRTFDFGETEQTVSAEFYNFMLQNREQTTEPEPGPEPDDETKVITPSWYEFNDTITLPDSTLTEEIDFIANNMTFSMITIDGSQIKYGEHGTIAYNPAWGGWMNGMQPEILIQSNQYVSGEFYEWFQANLTMLNGYDSYLEGYNQGYEQGKADGYEEGKTQGYNQGYYEGAADAGDYSFLNLLTAVVDAPVTVFVKLLDFEILGWNMTTVVISLLSVALIVTLIAYFSGKK